MSGPLSIAYVAGLFDGEGSVEIRRAERYRNPDVAPVPDTEVALRDDYRNRLRELNTR